MLSGNLQPNESIEVLSYQPLV